MEGEVFVPGESLYTLLVQPPEKDGFTPESARKEKNLFLHKHAPVSPGCYNPDCG
jgi:hypothetical protein